MFEIASNEERKRAAQYWWNKHQYQFVVVNYGTEKATGILKNLNELDYLEIVTNNGRCWTIDPLDIKGIYARPDKFAEGGGDAHLR